MKKKLFLIRHCQSWQNKIVEEAREKNDDSWFKENPWYSFLSNSLVPLTEAGKKQAVALGKFAPSVIDLDKSTHFLHSGFLRTQQTASLLNISENWQVSHTLREVSIGDLNHAGKENDYQETYEKFINDPYFRFPGGESFYDCLDRTSTFLRGLSSIHSEQIVVVSHSFFIQTLLFNLFGYPAYKIQDIPNIPELKIPSHGSIYEIEFDSKTSDFTPTFIKLHHAFEEKLSWRKEFKIDKAKNALECAENFEERIENLFKDS